MTYGQTVKTRYDFETVAAIAAAQRRKERRKLARIRKVKRVLHFIGFLSYWAIFAGIVYLFSVAFAIMCVHLS